MKVEIENKREMETVKILFVEDIYYNQVLVESILSDWGYKVVLAQDGNRALSILESEKFDLIVLDLMLPIMDGFKFLEEKKKLNINTPVIVLSARTDLESIRRALSLGAIDYITKPFNYSDLQNKIRAFINETLSE